MPKNFKITGDFYERVPRTTAEGIKAYAKAIGCLDGAPMGLTLPGIGLKCNLVINFLRFGPEAEAPGHPGYGTWPWHFGLYFNDLPSGMESFDFRQSHYRFPDHFSIFDNFYTDPDNALLSIVDFAQVSGSESLGTYNIGGFADNNSSRGYITMICPIIHQAPLVQMSTVLQRLSENAEIVDAWLEVKFEGLSRTTTHNINYSQLDISEGPNGLVFWSGAPEPDTNEVETETFIPKIGFGLIGQDVAGQWHTLGSAVDDAFEDVVDGRWCLVRVKSLVELIMSQMNSPYKALALYPAINAAPVAPEPDAFTHPSVGVMMAIYNAMQSFSFTAVAGDPSNPWAGMVGYKAEATFHDIQFNRFQLGSMWVQYKEDSGLLKTLRIVYGGYYPELVDAD